MTVKKHFTTEQAKEIGGKLGIDWSKFDVEQFRHGMTWSWSMEQLTLTPTSPMTIL